MYQKIILYSLVVFFAIVANGVAQEKVNPLFENWSKFNTGTSVTLLVTTTQNGKALSTSKQIFRLKNKTDNLVTVEIKSVMSAAGREFPGATSEMKVNKFMTPAERKLQEEHEQKAKVTRGKESLKIDGKTYECTWSQSEMEIAGGKSNNKSWMSDDIPGMTVKTFTKMSNGLVSEIKLQSIDKK